MYATVWFFFRDVSIFKEVRTRLALRFSWRVALFGATIIAQRIVFFKTSLFVLSIRYSMNFFHPKIATMDYICAMGNLKKNMRMHKREKNGFSLFWILFSRFCAIHFYYALKQCRLCWEQSSCTKSHCCIEIVFFLSRPILSDCKTWRITSFDVTHITLKIQLTKSMNALYGNTCMNFSWLAIENGIIPVVWRFENFFCACVCVCVRVWMENALKNILYGWENENDHLGCKSQIKLS